ncbi:hypothetical protein M8998_11830 [Sphingobacterium sp. lm-10]|uniref:hypothetical protein n=1 Tax=Sphingobacterium sp. lm-10 TaxID=2944904 RepID=UPI00201FED3A|nr:hypothetical protein [Sphingobacterium sp. lm-10]MCL7988627.1 hypothetical protein [Sphingobacterium sp. lm-10]
MKKKLLLCLVLLFSLGSAFILNAAQVNDSKELNELITKALSENKTIVLDRNRTYRIDKEIKPIQLKPGQQFSIEGNGAKINFVANTGNRESYLFHISSKDYNSTGSVSITNLHIEGAENPTQFAVRDYNKLRLAIPLFTERIFSVSMSNVSMRKIYGAGVRVNVFGQFSARNLDFKEVGGKWYTSNDYDSFGDAIYLGFARGDSQAIIENCHLEGYSATPFQGGFAQNLSRSAIVTEYNQKNLLNLSVSNCKLIGYHRSIHMEASRTALDVKNTEFNRFGCGVFVYGFEARDISIENSKFIDNVDAFFGGAKGVVTGFANNNKAVVTNSEVRSDAFWRENEMNVTYRSSQFKFNTYSRPSRASRFENCTFQTRANLGDDFGKMDNQSRTKKGNSLGTFIEDLVKALFG